MGFGLEMTSSPALSPTEHAASHTDSSPLHGDMHTYGLMLLSHHNIKQIAFVICLCVPNPQHEGMSPGAGERKVHLLS